MYIYRTNTTVVSYLSVCLNISVTVSFYFLITADITVGGVGKFSRDIQQHSSDHFTHFVRHELSRLPFSMRPINISRYRTPAHVHYSIIIIRYI